MKKLLFVCLVLGQRLFSNKIDAQTKIGYFNEEKTLKLFPGINEVDSLLQLYREDSIGSEFERRTDSIRTLDSLNKKDCKTAIPGKSCEEVTKNLKDSRALCRTGTDHTTDDWIQTRPAVISLQEKNVRCAYRKCSEEKYTLVLETESLSPYFTPPLLDNLMIRMALKLQLPLSGGQPWLPGKQQKQKRLKQ
jgi:hypothetical protein